MFRAASPWTSAVATYATRQATFVVTVQHRDEAHALGGRSLQKMIASSSVLAPSSKARSP